MRMHPGPCRVRPRCHDGADSTTIRGMTVRAAFVLGFFLVVAAILHGGLYSSGHDFVMNRFTGAYEFVPADDYEDSGDTKHVRTDLRLTSRRPAGRFETLQCRR